MALTFTDENIESNLNSGMPVVVDFWATWCGPCQALGPVIDQLAEKYNGRVLVGKYNCDDENDFAVANRVMSLPTILFFRGPGKPAIRLSGSQSLETLSAKVDELLAL